MRRLGCLIAAMLWVFGGVDSEARAPAERPNVILVMVDDLGFGDLGVTGATQIRTPHLDRMAREGALLTRFFASGNVCTPSRAGLLTGRYPYRSGLAHGVIRETSPYGLPPEEVTLAEALKAAGYRTAMIGKWHLGTVAGSRPTEQGFETFFGVPYSNDMNPFPLQRGTETIEDKIDQTTLTRRFAEEAVRLVEASATDATPFFLYVAHTAPHIPLFPHPDHAGRSKAGAYGDVVEEIDATMGMIRAALERTGQARDTLVLFTSDNGPWFEGSSRPFRDNKGTTYEGAYAVPLIAWQPGSVRRGARSDAISSNLDIFPTILARAGVTPPADRTIDGQDIWPLLQGGKQSPHEALYFFQNDQIAAVRTQDWRYVVQAYYGSFLVPFERFGAALLFDMRKDVSEAFDMSEREPEVLARMKALLEQGRRTFSGVEQKRTPVTLPPPQQPPQP